MALKSAVLFTILNAYHQFRIKMVYQAARLIHAFRSIFRPSASISRLNVPSAVMRSNGCVSRLRISGGPFFVTPSDCGH